MRISILVSLAAGFVAGISSANVIEGTSSSRVRAEVIAKFNSPWAMTFIDQKTALVTSKLGRLWLVSDMGEKREVGAVPKVMVGGQGGLGDIVAHPDFATNNWVYLSYIETKNSGRTRGAVVVRATLDRLAAPKLVDHQRIWAQHPKRSGRGHFSHRIAFGRKHSLHSGKIFITSGDRQEQMPAQSWDANLGKIIRLNEDGTLPEDNPFQDRGLLAKSFWSLGHRNALGIAFDPAGNLWAHEMGPRHGDELNLIEPGNNYGWPLVSEGNHYNGTTIPNHHTRPDFTPPIIYWVPTIAPSGLMFYSGRLFSKWQGNAFIGGLRSKALIRIQFDERTAREVERFEWNSRLREVEQAPDGSIWVLEDSPKGRLIRLTPSQ